MRVRTLEIRWHESHAIYSCDYQPLPASQLKKLLAPRIQRDPSASSLPSPNVPDVTQATPPSFRLATSGADNTVRLWMVYPNVLPPSVIASSSERVVPHPPRVEYLATLSRHTAVVNVVRFSPNGEFIASAGDDGMIAIWSATDRPVNNFGSDANNDDSQYGKEFWRVRIVARCTQGEVYDLAWSPNGEYVIAGSTDNAARIFNTADGNCVREIMEHSHFVQGVAWDPLNEFIATQSSDRSVHVYSISNKRGPFEIHAVGKNSRMPVRHNRTPSTSTTSTPHAVHIRPNLARRGSTTSEAESIVTTASEFKEEHHSSLAASLAAVAQNEASTSSSIPLDPNPRAPPTPTASVTSSSASAMFPPRDSSSLAVRSRRSSFSSTTGVGSPALSNRNFGRSPSPMPPLPAVRTPIAPPTWANVKLYGDENFTSFFRRLTFSPDGGLLLTPAGQFEDPSVIPGRSSSKPSGSSSDSSAQTRKPSGNADGGSAASSSVYIYSRANFARPPVAHLPGHKTASVAVKFSPVLYELRPNVSGPRSGSSSEVKKIVIEVGKEHDVDLNIGGPSSSGSSNKPSSSASQSAPRSRSSPAAGLQVPPSPAPSTPSGRARTPSSGPQMSSSASTASVFALPYRMIYAVVTTDTVMIYDTQQAGPICMFTNLHYGDFTDVAWAPDGQSLMLSSADGYCSIVIFDEFLPLYHTQQHNLQLQAIASTVSTPQHVHHALPSWPGPSINSAPSSDVSSAPSTITVAQPVPGSNPLKRSDPPLPTPSGDTDVVNSTDVGSSTPSGEDADQPKKKKRRVQLTHHGNTE